MSTELVGIPNVTRPQGPLLGPSLRLDLSGPSHPAQCDDGCETSQTAEIAIPAASHDRPSEDEWT